MDSVIQSEKRCFVCGKEFGLESHHLYMGNPNRKNSERYGMKVWLCAEHHRGNSGVHHDIRLDWQLKRIGQEKFEQQYSRSKFIDVFGRNYLED